jgi:uncharacterized membrane protein
MALFLIGLLIFLASHSSRIFAESWRNKMIDQIGEVKWKGLYTIISLIGFNMARIVGLSSIDVLRMIKLIYKQRDFFCIS